MHNQDTLIVLTYSLLRNVPQLCISPLGCVPQRGHRPRIINDYTFSGVNVGSHKMAPSVAMQWWQTLHRIIWLIFNSEQRHGLVFLSKKDLSDSFYQIHLTPSGALKIAVPFPNKFNRPKLVVISTRLLMVWTDLPPDFSATTETISDIENELLKFSPCIPPDHSLEHATFTHVPIIPSSPDAFSIHEAGPLRPTLAYVGV